jgi:hypothetical protein
MKRIERIAALVETRGKEFYSREKSGEEGYSRRKEVKILF